VLPQLDDYFELSVAGIKAAKAPPSRRVDLRQIPSDWHNAFSDFTIRLSQRLHDLPDADKLALMQALQGRLSELGAEPSPKGRPSPITPVGKRKVSTNSPLAGSTGRAH
jgi:metallo-beta-lactamase family protein